MFHKDCRACREISKHVCSACGSPALSWALTALSSARHRGKRGGQKHIFFLVLGTTQQVNGSQRTDFVCISQKMFSSLSKCLCFSATCGKLRLSKGKSAWILSPEVGWAWSHPPGPCPSSPFGSLLSCLQGVLLKICCG